MRNAKCCLIVCVLAALLSGCGFKDIDRRFFVIAVAVDPGKTHKFNVSLMLAIPSPKVEPGESKNQILSQEADSIAVAVREMKSKVDKEFDFGHTKVLLFGKEFAEAHMDRQSLDWFLRRRDIQQIAYMGIGVPDGKSVLESKPKSERLPGNALVLAFSSEGTESPYLVPAYLFDYFRRLRDRGADPYLPIVKAQKETFEINQVAVFDDYKTILQLTPQQTAVFNQIVRRYPNIILFTEVDRQRLAFNVQTMNMHYRIATPRNEDPQIIFRVKAEGEIEDSSVSLFDKDWAKIKQRIEDSLEQQYLDLLQTLQQKGVDPVGFGLRYRASRHSGNQEIKAWDSLYPKVKFIVHADVKIRGTGIIK